MMEFLFSKCKCVNLTITSERVTLLQAATTWPGVRPSFDPKRMLEPKVSNIGPEAWLCKLTCRLFLALNNWSSVTFVERRAAITAFKKKVNDKCIIEDFYYFLHWKFDFDSWVIFMNDKLQMQEKTTEI